MDEPAVKFSILKQIKFKNPSFPVIVTMILHFVKMQMSLKLDWKIKCNGVRWRETMDLTKDSDLHFVEIGPSNVLSGLAKRHLKDVKITQVSSSNQITY